MDRDVVTWVAAHRVGWLDPVFVGLTVVGYAGVVWLALALLVAWRGRLPLRPTVGLTAIAVLSADLVAWLLKALVERPRPFQSILDLDTLMRATEGTSFPSGHAATSAAGAVVLSLLAPRLAPAFVALALAIGFSRIYVGVHYPTDVLAGLAIGAAIGAAVGLGVRGALADPRGRSRTATGPGPRS